MVNTSFQHWNEHKAGVGEVEMSDTTDNIVARTLAGKRDVAAARSTAIVGLAVGCWLLLLLLLVD